MLRESLLASISIIAELASTECDFLDEEKNLSLLKQLLKHNAPHRRKLLKSKLVYYLENPKMLTLNSALRERGEFHSSLNQMLSHFKASFLQDGVYFSNEADLFAAFETLFSEELLREPPCRKISSEIWKCSASSRHKANQKTALFNEDVYVRLELFCSGLAVLSKNEQNFHLHRAVFDNNLPALEEMAERLLEATQRGLWRDSGDYAERLQDLLLDIDAQQESAL